MGGLASFLSGEDPDQYYNAVGAAPTPGEGAYTPGTQNAQNVSAAQTGPNALAGANGSAAGQSAQMQALQQLQQQAQGGLNASDKSALFQAENQQGEQNAGQQGAILQGAAERGQANSGNALAAQLSAQQGAEQASANEGADIAGQAANRALGATQEAGQLGGNINQQAFNQQATIGNAQNALNEANAGREQQAGIENQAAGNQASEFNINNKIAAAQFLARLQQQQYEDQLQKASDQAGTSAGQETASLGALGDVAKGVGAIGATAFGGPAAGAATEEALGGGGTDTSPDDSGSYGESEMAHGGKVPFTGGGKVPGKPKVNHDSYANDTVPAMLTPKEVVVDLDTQHKGPAAVISFLEKHMDMDFDAALKHGAKSKSKEAR